MKTFSAMSQGDLIIIRDALQDTIQKQRAFKLFDDEISLLFSHQPMKYIEKTSDRLHTLAAKYTRIGELLAAIDEALHQDDSE